MNNLRRRITLPLVLALYVFAILTATMLCVGLVAFIFYRLGWLGWEGWEDAWQEGYEYGRPNFFGPVFGILFTCIVMGTALAAIFSRLALRPIRQLVEATEQVARGDFDVRVPTSGIRELVELSASFNTMTDELRSIEMLRSDFVNTISHEFKTPIVSIRGFARLLSDNRLTEAERQEYLDIIISESDRLVQLSTSILNLSKVEITQIVSDRQPFRLDEQLRRIIVMLEPLWSARGLTIDLQADALMYNGNEDLVSQIWLNLLDNAIKFSEPGGEVGIRVVNDGAGVVVTIRDTGIGMSAEVQSRIFERFYQGDASRSASGNGLGLPIVKRIVELCGGSIEVQSIAGAGSSFVVTL